MSQQLGREVVLHALGQTWRLARFDYEMMEEFVAFAAKQIRNPLEDLAPVIQYLPVPAAMELIREAQAKRPLAMEFDSPVVQEFKDSTRGGMHLFWLMFSKHHPNVTKSQVFAIAEELGPEKMKETFEAAWGKLPPPPAKNGTPEGAAAERALAATAS